MTPVAHVNSQDRVVGSGTIADAIAHGRALRIARVFILNGNGMLLLQRRSPRIRASSMKWDQSAGGHVDAGETYLQAAKRELREEMGIKGVRLRRLTKFYTEDPYDTMTRKRFNVLFWGTYNGHIAIDNDEVAAYQWIALNDLKQQLQANPAEFTLALPVALAAFEKYYS